jgi:hypothetical protein
MTPTETLALLKIARAVLEHYQFDSRGIARDDVVNVCMEIDDELDAAPPAVPIAQSITDAAA